VAALTYAHLMTDVAPQQHPTSPSTPAGWYPDAAGVQRWWDGYAWTEHTAPAPQVAPQPQQPQYAPVVVNNGGVRHYKTSHGFHLIMTLVTLGLWAPVWIIVGVMNASRSN
jgi:hypothetical protein